MPGEICDGRSLASSVRHDLIREDVLEFSRLQEVKVMQLLVEMLRERVGSPLSYASLPVIGGVSCDDQTYVDILQALFIVFCCRLGIATWRAR